MSLGNQQSQGGAQFLKIKAGKFYLSTDKEEKNPFDTLSGHLTNIYQKSESFNGKDIEKTYFVVTSEEGAYQFNLGTGTSQWALFVSFLKNTSPRDPMSIQAAEGKPTSNGNISTNLFINQNGTAMKAYYKKDGEHQLPAWVKHEIGKNVVWDKTDWENVLLADLEEIKGKIGGTIPTTKSEKPNNQSQGFHPVTTPNPPSNSKWPEPNDTFDDQNLPF